MAKDSNSGNKTWADASPDKEDRPWERRGFYVITPTSNYPSLGAAELRNSDFEFKANGADPNGEMAPMQLASKDSAPKGPKA